jgi:hypothetical protein
MACANVRSTDAHEALHLLVVREENAVPGGTPKVLQPRHRRMAWLMAGGLRRAEIARLAGYAPTSVSHIARSPAFQALVVEYQRELRHEFVDATVDRLLGPPGVRRGRRS